MKGRIFAACVITHLISGMCMAFVFRSFFESDNVLSGITHRTESDRPLHQQSSESPPKRVSFPTPDGGLIFANLYGKGERGVVLVHGGRFNKESWVKQARAIVKAGFRVLSIDLRGYGQSRGPKQSNSQSPQFHLDVLTAIRYMRQNGAKTVSIVGASMGGIAAAHASVEAKSGEIDRLVLLAHGPIDNPEKMKGRKLFILSRDDFSGDNKIPRLPEIRDQYEKAPGPKELVILDGSAHAQYIFETEQGERLMREILRFLSDP